MPKFQKRPILIEAEQFDPERIPWPRGLIPWNPIYVGRMHPETAKPDWDVIPIPRDMSLGYIDTLEGRMHAWAGDWIIIGIAGEIYPCKDAIFRQTYDAIEDHPYLPA